jgi:hypothetical protein
VNEQKLTREDARDRASAIKTPKQYYGPTLVRHMRLAQADTEGGMPAVHHDLAKVDKKGLVRQIQQLHLDVICSTQGKAYLKLPIVPGISECLHLGDWYMRSLDDLTLGINVFVLGGCTQADVTSMEEMVSAYDLAASTTGANYNDMKVIMATKNVHISTNYAHARLDLQRIEMLMRLYWGNNNVAVQAVVQFLFDFDGHITDLMEYRPRSANHDVLVPGLVLRYFTAYLNLWVGGQLETDTKLPFPAEVQKVWHDLRVQNPVWERPFPPKYLTTAPNLQAAVYGSMPRFVPLVVTPGGDTGPPSSQPSSTAGAATPRKVQEMQRNTYPNGNEEAFAVFRTRMANSKSKFKKVIQEAEAAGKPVPKNNKGGDMCVPFHVLGLCNNFCNRRNDHNGLNGGAVHTKAEDDMLLRWCESAIPET